MAVGTACQWNGARLESAATRSLRELGPDGAGNEHRLQHADCKTRPGQLIPNLASHQITDFCAKAELETETELMCFQSFSFIESWRERARGERKDYFFYRWVQATIIVTYNST